MMVYSLAVYKIKGEIVMPKSAVKTGDLFMMIEKTDDLATNWQDLCGDMDNPTFGEYLSDLIAERNIDASRLGVISLVSRSFTYQILSGVRIPSREIVLRVAVAVGLTVDETQRLLTLADRGVLYPKVERDAALIYCLTNGYDLYQTDDLLKKLKLKPLI